MSATKFNKQIALNPYEQRCCRQATSIQYTLSRVVSRGIARKFGLRGRDFFQLVLDRDEHQHS